MFDLIYHIVTDAGLAIFFASMFFVGAIDVLSLPAWMNGMLMITGTAGFAVALLHFGLRIPREATDALDGLRSHGTLRAKILAGVAGLFMLGFLAMVLFIVIIYPVAEISRQLRG
ncbi:MAG: hypothetical protein Q4G26_08240 [Paracoccus sp. (in: a-proteobacteria)]|nr:hypothetical protein [Paracoccus sp. (in: a-proteobacteria)]